MQEFLDVQERDQIKVRYAHSKDYGLLTLDEDDNVEGLLRMYLEKNGFSLSNASVKRRKTE